MLGAVHALMYGVIQKKGGKRRPPWVAPEEIGVIAEENPWILRNCFLPSIKKQNYDKSSSLKPVASKILNNIWWPYILSIKNRL